MSLALFASPIDYKDDGTDQKIKNKLSRDMLQNTLQNNAVPSSKHGNYNEIQGIEIKPDFSNKYSDKMISDIHKNLKEENDTELSNFYKTELNNMVIPEVKTNQYMLMDDNNVEKFKRNGDGNDELLSKLDRVIEMFEEQREIKTTQKNEEIVLYCFLGVFTIYILDSFVSIGKYTR